MMVACSSLGQAPLICHPIEVVDPITLIHQLCLSLVRTTGYEGFYSPRFGSSDK